MQKLKLDLEELRVESFGTAEEPEPRGTVHGRYTSGPVECMSRYESAGCGTSSGFGCPSEVCSGGECQSWSGCDSYENTCLTCDTRDSC